jgi:hypothetical protein
MCIPVNVVIIGFDPSLYCFQMFSHLEPRITILAAVSLRFEMRFSSDEDKKGSIQLQTISHHELSCQLIRSSPFYLFCWVRGQLAAAGKRTCPSELELPHLSFVFLQKVIGMKTDLDNSQEESYLDSRQWCWGRSIYWRIIANVHLETTRVCLNIGHPKFDGWIIETLYIYIYFSV